MIPKPPSRRIFPSADEDARRAEKPLPPAQSASFRLAYQDPEFLLRDELRPVRLQLELLKPELILQEHHIESTIVVYGSARTLPPDIARAALAAAEARLAAEPGIGVADVLAELDRRAAAESEAVSGGVNLLTYHRAKGLEWDAVYLPSLDEGLLPIRQARELEEIAEERRLLYVGITRARRHLVLSCATRRPSRFLLELSPKAGRRSSGAGARVRGEAGKVRVLPGAPIAVAVAADDRLLEALRKWRRERAMEDAVPAYVVAHDTMLAAIADERPRSIPALRRIRGMGPAKLERYGAQILAVVEAAGD